MKSVGTVRPLYQPAGASFLFMAYLSLHAVLLVMNRRRLSINPCADITTTVASPAVKIAKHNSRVQKPLLLEGGKTMTLTVSVSASKLERIVCLL